MKREKLLKDYIECLEELAAFISHHNLWKIIDKCDIVEGVDGNYYLRRR